MTTDKKLDTIIQNKKCLIKIHSFKGVTVSHGSAFFSFISIRLCTPCDKGEKRKENAFAQCSKFSFCCCKPIRVFNGK